MDCDQIIYFGLLIIAAIFVYRHFFRKNIRRGGYASGGRHIPRGIDESSSIIEGFKPGGEVDPKFIPGVPTPPQVQQKQWVSSEGLGNNEVAASVPSQDRTPSSCYPQKVLTASELLPGDDSAAISDFNQEFPIGEGVQRGINYLSAGYHVGVNTVGQSLRNANRQLRSEPPNPQVSVSPWMTSTIAPDLDRRPLEVTDSCAVTAGV